MDAIAPMTGNPAYGAGNAAVHHLASIHARALAWIGEQPEEFVSYGHPDARTALGVSGGKRVMGMRWQT